MRRLLHNLILKHSQGQIEAAVTDENPESQGAGGSSPGEHLSDVPCQRSVHSAGVLCLTQQSPSLASNRTG